jgi:histidinol-phosphatase (PHP family)
LPPHADNEQRFPNAQYYSQLTSLHVHTVFCDGADDVETMCRAAYDTGLTAIGFSSHAPLTKTLPNTECNMPAERLEEYIGEVNAARQRWEGKIAVYPGLEIDYVKGLRSALDNDVKNAHLDYCISSVHYLVPPCGPPFTVDGPPEELAKGIAEGFGGNGEAMVSAYWDAIAEMIALGGFDIVGHLDLVKKHNSAGRWFNTASGASMRRIEEIAQAVSAAGLVVEVNTGGINRGYITETYPSLAILRLIRQHHIPVMISADAHNANDIAGHYPMACQTLLQAGYTSHVIFEGRSNGKPVWKEVPVPAVQ